MNSVIIFDGECGFCNKTVMFFAKNDTNNCFKFVSNHSVFGIELSEKHKIKGMEKSTIILIEKEIVYTKSLAIRKILLKIPKYRILGSLMFLIPNRVSDCLYGFISKHRKRIVNNDYCEIPISEIKEKFML